MTSRCWTLLLVLMLAVAPTSCHRASDELGDGSAESDGNRLPVDPSLLAFLSRARSAHHRADLVEEKDPKAAEAALQEVLGGPFPPNWERMAEVREVLSDTHARVADLASRRGDFDRALKHVRSGLELARETSYFRGHLFEVEGFVDERRAEALRAQADELLAQVDETLTDAELGELHEHLERLEAAKEELKNSPASPNAQERLSGVEQEVETYRRAKQSAEERTRYDRLLEERDEAVQRALQAFEASMKVQERVIRSRLPPAKDPTAPGQGAQPAPSTE